MMGLGYGITRWQARERAGRRVAHLIAALLAVGWFALGAAGLKGDPAAPAAPASKSIFDDDFPGVDKEPTAGKSAAPTPKPKAPARTPNPVPPPADPSQPAPIFPQAVQHAPAGTQDVTPGLVAELYDNAGTLKDARLVKRIRVTINAPKAAMMTDVMRWHGLIQIPAGGMSVSFRFEAQGTAEVSIDGRPVADQRTGRVLQLTEGQHKLAVTVKNVALAAALQTLYLGWTPSGEEFQSVPSTVYFHSRQEEPQGLQASASPSANGSSPAAPAAPTLSAVAVPRPAGTLAVPTDAQLADLRKAIKAKYSADYANTSHVVREALVNKLVAAAGESTDAPPSRYALLREATDLSLALGDLKTALTCTDQICADYKVNVPEVKLGALTAAARVPKTLGIGRAVGDAAMALSIEAADDNEYDFATRAAQLAESVYGSSSEDAARATARLRDIRLVQTEYARIAPLLKKLKENPNDPDSNTKAGRYFCLTVGDFAKGLPFLVKGNDTALKVLAEMESSPPTDADNEVKLGDGWWDKAHAETMAASNSCKNRAGFWYDKARAASKDLPSRIIDRLATLSRTIDLIPLIDLNPPPDAAGAGQPTVAAARRSGNSAWKRDHDDLVCGAGFNSVLQLPYRPAGEYDFIVEFTTPAGDGGIVQMMPVRDALLEWFTVTTISNSRPLALRPGSFGPMLKGQVPIIGGQRYVSTVEFRRTGVRGYINGVLIRSWDTDYSEVGTRIGRLPDPQCLGLYCNGNGVVVHSIRIVEHGQR